MTTNIINVPEDVEYLSKEIAGNIWAWQAKTKEEQEWKKEAIEEISGPWDYNKDWTINWKLRWVNVLSYAIYLNNKFNACINTYHFNI